MRNRFMERLEELAAGTTYEEFVDFCLLAEQCDGRFIADIRRDVGAVYVHAYDTSDLAGGELLTVIIPEDAPPLTEEEARAAHPGYRRPELAIAVRPYGDPDELVSAFFCFADAQYRQVPPWLRAKKAAVDAEPLPLLQEDVKERKKAGLPGPGTVRLDAAGVVQFHDRCVRDGAPERFREKYFCSFFDPVELGGADALRGDRRAQEIVAEAVGYLCEAGCPVELEIWDLDDGFETLRGGVMDLISRGLVTLVSTRADN